VAAGKGGRKGGGGYAGIRLAMLSPSWKVYVNPQSNCGEEIFTLRDDDEDDDVTGSAELDSTRNAERKKGRKTKERTKREVRST